MADDLNSLLQANRSSSVLQGIMNPAQVNPLAAINSATQTAGGIYNIRKLQAEQVAGQLATESIDPVTKQFDPNVYNAKIAAAGPSVAMAAQAGLQNASTLSQTQLGQQHMKVGYVQGVLGALNDNSSRDQVMSALDRGVASGMLTPTDRDNMAAHVPTDPAAMPAFIQQARLANASSMDQYHAAYGTTGSQTGPNGATIGFVQKPAAQGGGISAQPQAGAPQGMSPEDANTIVQVPYPQFLPDGKTPNPNYGRSFPMRKGDVVPLLTTPGQLQGGPGAGDSGLPPSLRNPANTAPPAATPASPAGVQQGSPTAPQAVPAPRGASGASTAPYTGGGAGAAISASPAAPTATTVAPAAPAPNVTTPDRTTPTPPPAVAAPAPIPPGPRAGLQGGVPVAAAANALQPNVGAPGSPSGAVPGDVDAILAGMNRARAAPTAGAAVAGSPTYFGTGPSAADLEQQKRGVEQGMTGFQAISDQAVASRSRSAILGNMLGDTTQFSTGPLTSKIATLRNIANRFGLPINIEGLSAQESFNKLAAQLATAQNPNSDAKLSVSQAANPHQELSPAGVDLMMRQLQGNEDYYQARGKLAAAYGDQKDIKKFENDVGSKVDPRAFQVARMTPEQRRTYDAGLSDTDRATVRASYNWLAAQKLLPGN